MAIRTSGVSARPIVRVWASAAFASLALVIVYPLHKAALAAPIDRGIYVQDASHGGDYASTEQAFSEFKGRVDYALAQSFVSGFATVYRWRSFAPSTEAESADYDHYHFAPIDYALQKAAKTGKGVSITLSTADFAPDYVKQLCPTFGFTHPAASIGNQTAPTPWSECYYKYLERAVKALSRRYDGNSNVRFISINGPSTLFGVETNWPMVRGSIDDAGLGRLQFSLLKYVQEWERSISLYERYFPRTQLALALSDKIGFDGVTEPQAFAAASQIKQFAIATYSQSSKRADKRIVLRLLGLTNGNSKFFRGPRDRSNSALTPYVSLIAGDHQNAKVMLESSRVESIKGTSATEYYNILENGVSWGAVCIDIKYPDLIAYPDQLRQISNELK